jgi:iron complex transport system permease protein
MVASVIAFAGIIGFVGLVCPHIVRTIIDADNRFVIPASAILGSIMLLGGMVISELLATPTLSVPLGVVLSFIGAPIFLILIIRRNSNVW